MEKQEALNIYTPNRITVLAVSTLAFLGGNALKADSAQAAATVESDITCPSTGFQPEDDPCVGRATGTRIINTNYSDYPATDPALERTLYINPNGTRESIYTLDYGKRDVVWDANDVKQQCYVYPTTGQLEECSTYDAANNTSDVVISDELTVGENGGGDDDDGGGTDPGPDMAHIQACVNKDADIANHQRGFRTDRTRLRTFVLRAYFKNLRQIDPTCNDVDTNRNISVQFYQKRRDGKYHAITKRHSAVKPANDDGRWHKRWVRTAQTAAGRRLNILCGRKFPIFIRARATSYADVDTNNDGIRETRVRNQQPETLRTGNFRKSC